MSEDKSYVYTVYKHTRYTGGTYTHTAELYKARVEKVSEKTTRIVNASLAFGCVSRIDNATAMFSAAAAWELHRLESEIEVQKAEAALAEAKRYLAHVEELMQRGDPAKDCGGIK